MNIIYNLSRGLKYILNPKAIKLSNIDKRAKVLPGCQVVNSNIGKYSYIAYDTSIIYCNIGSFCSIAIDCYIGGPSHPIDWISTSPVFCKGRNVLNYNFSKHEYNPFKITNIGNDVWIGAKCKIKAGVNIGDGAIIGMGSVVTKNIPPYEIWAGNPAKYIRKRFEQHIIDNLLSMKWWEMSKKKELKNYSICFNDKNKAKKMLREEYKLNGEI